MLCKIRLLISTELSGVRLLADPSLSLAPKVGAKNNSHDCQELKKTVTFQKNKDKTSLLGS